MRFEITGDRIRARYGHSVPQTVTYPEVQPPNPVPRDLAEGAARGIQKEGLQPMGRQYVHLSTQVDQARLVGRRHAPEPGRPDCASPRGGGGWGPVLSTGRAVVSFDRHPADLHRSTCSGARLRDEER